MSTSYTTATRDDAAVAWQRLSTKQQRSVVGGGFATILELLDASGHAPLQQVLKALFPDEPDAQRAKTAFGTQIVNRPPLDEAGQALIRVATSAVRGKTPSDKAAALTAATVWFELAASASLESLATEAPIDLAENFTATPSLRQMGSTVIATAVSDALRSALSKQSSAGPSKARANFGTRASSHGLDGDDPNLPLDEFGPSAKPRTADLHSAAVYNAASMRGLEDTYFVPGTQAAMHKQLPATSDADSQANPRRGKQGREQAEGDLRPGNRPPEATDDDASAANRGLTQEVTALPALLQWALDASNESPRLCALLGDSGTGKTTHGQQFVRVLNGLVAHPDWPVATDSTNTGPALALEAKPQPARNPLSPLNSRQPLPKALFIDLAELAGVSNLAELSLEEMLVLVLKKRDGVRIQTVADVAHFVTLARAGQLVFVFDGVDELLNKNPSQVLQNAFNQFLRVVVPEATAGGAHNRPPKAIISCRSHYFRDVEQQHAFFTARQRSSVAEADYLCLTLLPWESEQIESYLTKRVGADQAPGLMALIQSTYNLGELASRPVLLAMMAEQLNALLSHHVAGHDILASALYNQTVAGWIGRDNGKHRLPAALKPVLMGALAAAMWNDGSELWSADRLDSWLARSMRELFTDHFDPKELPALQEDLRTAAFIVRPHEREFNFAHKSYGEYFLARFVIDGLTRVRQGDWTLAQLRQRLPERALNAEATQFLTEMWATRYRTTSFSGSRANSATNTFTDAKTSNMPARSERLQRELAGDCRLLCELLQGLGQTEGEGLADDPSADEPQPLKPAPALHNTLWRLLCALPETDFSLSSVSTAGHQLAAGVRSPSTTQARRLNLRGLICVDEVWQALRLKHAPPLDLRGANLRGMHFRQCEFGAVLCDAATNLSQTVWRACDVRRVVWGDAERGGMLVRGLATALPAPVSDSAGAPARQALPGPWSEVHAVSRVTSVAFSPCGAHVLTGSDDGITRLWDLQTGTKLRAFLGYRVGVTSVAFSPSGAQALAGSRDYVARLWDVQTGVQLRVFDGCRTAVTSVAFSPSGTLVLTNTGNNAAGLWDARTGTQLREFKGHRDIVTNVAFCPNGTRVLTGSADGTARLWDAHSAAQQRAFIGHSAAVTSVAFSPGGELVATGSRDGSACLWDAQTGIKLQAFVCGGVTCVAFSRSGAQVITGSDDGIARLWDAKTGVSLGVFIGHAGRVTSVAFSSGGEQLLTGSDDCTARLWDAITGAQLRTFTGRSESVTSMALSASGARVLTGSRGNSASIWHAQTGARVRSFIGHKNWITSAGISPDGERVLTGSDDHTLRLWDTQTGAQLRAFDDVTSVAFNADCSRVITGSMAGPVCLWEAHTGAKLRTLVGIHNSGSCLAYGRSGVQELLCTQLGHVTSLWNARTGAQLTNFPSHGAIVTCAAFSAGGGRVLTGSWDCTARLWDVQTTARLQTFTGHNDWVTCVAFSPSGAQVVTGSCDTTARLWDAQTGAQLQVLEGQGREVTNVAFSPDGSQIFTASRDGSVRIWNLADRSYRVIVPHPLPPFEPSWADFDAQGNLLDWSESAVDHWLFRIRDGRAEPVEAAL